MRQFQEWIRARPCPSCLTVVKIIFVQFRGFRLGEAFSDAVRPLHPRRLWDLWLSWLSCFVNSFVERHWKAATGRIIELFIKMRLRLSVIDALERRRSAVDSRTKVRPEVLLVQNSIRHSIEKFYLSTAILMIRAVVYVFPFEFLFDKSWIARWLNIYLINDWREKYINAKLRRPNEENSSQIIFIAFVFFNVTKSLLFYFHKSFFLLHTSLIMFLSLFNMFLFI